MSQITRQAIIALTAILGVLLFGTCGYVLIEDWSFIDSFYMSVITVTTVGYGEINPLSEQGRMFTVVLILSGFGVVAMMASQLAQLVIEGDIKTMLWKRKMGKRINQLNKH
ncbi:MAG: potassium channel family protein, partial [Planctomycetota bacterium]